ncbi:MAG: sigma-54-dependent transcriptional regulator [Thermodesulfobacteriota bacterium]
MSGTVLIIDDEVQLVRSLEHLLKSQGYKTVGVHDGAAARRAIITVLPDIVLVDLKLPDIEGTDLLAELREIYPSARYIIMTAHGSIKVAVEAMRRGACDYLTKPFEPDELLLSLETALREGIKEAELSLLRKSGRAPHSGAAEAADARGSVPEYPSRAMQVCLAGARRAAATDSIVLLLGESGSGKDYLARYIHDHSRRSEGPFFTINCAAVAPELAESELFGHEPGAFTGSRGRKRGLLELAEGGTLFLNEIGDLSLLMQAKLLTFLDSRTFTRVGGETQIAVDARLIVATNKMLAQEAILGHFRADLYYRLNVFTITVPSLRERREDIPVLVKEILRNLVSERVTAVVPRVDPAAMNSLLRYEWPGNVRELRNILERALILSDDGRIGVHSLALESSQREWSFVSRFPDTQSIHEVADDLKRSLIEEALRRSGGAKQEAARLLGISRHALAHQMKSLGLDE